LERGYKRSGRILGRCRVRPGSIARSTQDGEGATRVAELRHKRHKNGNTERGLGKRTLIVKGLFRSKSKERKPVGFFVQVGGRGEIVAVGTR